MAWRFGCAGIRVVLEVLIPGIKIVRHVFDEDVELLMCKLYDAGSLTIC